MSFKTKLNLPEKEKHSDPRWAEFLVYKEGDPSRYSDEPRQYGTGYRDDSLAHDDYNKGIHVSIPQYMGIVQGTKFEYGGYKMKAEHVQQCQHWKDSVYVFCKAV